MVDMHREQPPLRLVSAQLQLHCVVALRCSRRVSRTANAFAIPEAGGARSIPEVYVSAESVPQGTAIPGPPASAQL